MSGATQVAIGESYMSVVASTIGNYKLSVSCKCVVDIGPNVIIKVQVKNDTTDSSNYINNVLIIDEK